MLNWPNWRFIFFRAPYRNSPVLHHIRKVRPRLPTAHLSHVPSVPSMPIPNVSQRLPTFPIECMGMVNIRAANTVNYSMRFHCTKYFLVWRLAGIENKNTQTMENFFHFWECRFTSLGIIRGYSAPSDQNSAPGFKRQSAAPGALSRSSPGEKGALLRARQCVIEVINVVKHCTLLKPIV